MCSVVQELQLYLVKEKAIYHHMNMLSIQNHFFEGYCWYPEDKEQLVNNIINELTKKY